MTEPSRAEPRIFAVETRFQQLARRPGGVSRQEAVQKAREKLAAIAPDFEQWLAGELAKLDEAMRRIAHDVTDTSDLDRSDLQAMAESGYQLQSIGTTMGCDLISHVAESLCGILDTIAGGTRCNVDAIRCHVDALNLAARRNYRHMRPDQVPQLTAGLRRIAEQAVANPSANRTLDS